MTSQISCSLDRRQRRRILFPIHQRLSKQLICVKIVTYTRARSFFLHYIRLFRRRLHSFACVIGWGGFWPSSSYAAERLVEIAVIC